MIRYHGNKRWLDVGLEGVKAPPGMPYGRFRVRLRTAPLLVAAREDFTEGPAVEVIVPVVTAFFGKGITFDHVEE